MTETAERSLVAALEAQHDAALRQRWLAHLRVMMSMLAIEPEKRFLAAESDAFECEIRFLLWAFEGEAHRILFRIEDGAAQVLDVRNAPIRFH